MISSSPAQEMGFPKSAVRVTDAQQAAKDAISSSSSLRVYQVPGGMGPGWDLVGRSLGLPGGVGEAGVWMGWDGLGWVGMGWDGELCREFCEIMVFLGVCGHAMSCLFFAVHWYDDISCTFASRIFEINHDSTPRLQLDRGRFCGSCCSGKG